MASPPNVKESDSDTEFLDLLEDAFLDLESAVADSSAAQQDDVSQAAGSSDGMGNKRRCLPPGVRQKLNEVGNLTIAKYGKVTIDFFDRLHSILGDIMPRRNLRNGLKRMINKHRDALQKGTEAEGSSEQDNAAMQQDDEDDEDDTDEP